MLFLKKTLAVLLTLTMAVCCLLPAMAATQDLYAEEFYWDKAGWDADNGYKAYMIPFGDPLKIPEDPAREGSVFLGWKDWFTDSFVDLANETMNAKGRRFYAAWSVKTVPSYFYVFGELLTTVENIPGQPFIHPRLPEREGYTFAGWSPEIPEFAPAESMTFHAVFKPNIYIATLLVDGEVYKEIPYTYGQKSITLPDVPEKPGYTGAWEPYSLVVGGVTIRAVYTPETYIATLIVDGKVYKEIPYTYGQKSINLPEVPKKPGYSGAWEPYSLVIGGVKIEAVYTILNRTSKTIAGDADGDSQIGLKDVTVMERTLAGGWDVDGCSANMDVNGDGEMNLKDVILVRRYIVGGWDVVLF